MNIHSGVEQAINNIAAHAAERGLTFRDAARDLGVQSIDESLGRPGADRFKNHNNKHSAFGRVSQGSYNLREQDIPMIDTPPGCDYDLIYGGDGRGPGYYGTVGPGLYDDKFMNPANGRSQGVSYGIDRKDMPYGPHYRSGISRMRVREYPRQYGRGPISKVYYDPDEPTALVGGTLRRVVSNSILDEVSTPMMEEVLSNLD
jgi:hypothetical protein